MFLKDKNLSNWLKKVYVLKIQTQITEPESPESSGNSYDEANRKQPNEMQAIFLQSSYFVKCKHTRCHPPFI